MRVVLGAVSAASLFVFFACGGGSPPPAQQPGPIGDPLATPSDSAAIAPLPAGSASAAPAASGGVATPPSGGHAGSAVVMLSGLHAPNAVAVGKADVARILKTGGTQMTVYAGTGQPFQSNSSIAIDDTDVYWTSQIDKASSLNHQDKNGGKPTVVTSSTFAPIQCVAIDEAAMYWVLGGGVIKQSKKGGGPQALAGGFKGADCIAVDGDHVYWSVSGTEANKFADGAIIESSKTGANVHVLVKGADHAENVKADGEAVYWQSGPKVFKAMKKTGEAVKLAEGSGKVADIAIDDHYVYFLTPDAVARVNKQGGRGETMVDGLAAPTSIGVDATTVYFTTKGTEAAKWHDGTLQKVDKP
jgi:hypothetical protein